MDFEALHVANASQINASHHGRPPEPLPFSRAEIMTALEAVDECLVAPGQVLVVWGMLQGHAPSVVHFQHRVRRRVGGQVVQRGPRQDVGGFLDRHRAVIDVPRGSVVDTVAQHGVRLNVLELERSALGLECPRCSNSWHRQEARGFPKRRGAVRRSHPKSIARLVRHLQIQGSALSELLGGDERPQSSFRNVAIQAGPCGLVDVRSCGGFWGI